MLRNRHSLEEKLLRDFLKRKRIEQGFSQRKLSLLLDNTPTFVSKYESGERYLLFTEAVLICEILGIDAHELTQSILNTLRTRADDDVFRIKQHPPIITEEQMKQAKTPPSAKSERRSLSSQA